MTIRGMDVEEVERLVGQLEFQANAINAVVGVVDTVVGTLTSVWFGADLQRFHGTWQGNQRAQANAAAVDIDHTLTLLRRELADQRQTSGGLAPGVRGVTGSRAGDTDLLRPLLGAFQNWYDYALTPIVGLTQTVLFGRFVPRGLDGRFLKAQGSWRTVLNNMGRLDEAKVFTQKPGMSAQYGRWAAAGKVLGPLGAVIGGGIGAYGQWQQDAADPSKSTAERAGRAGAVGVATGAGGFAGAWAGAAVGGAIGSAVPVPVVGTAVGAVVGGVIGGFAGSTAGQEMGNLIKEPVGEATAAVSDFVGHGLESAGKSAAALADALSFWD